MGLENWISTNSERPAGKSFPSRSDNAASSGCLKGVCAKPLLSQIRRIHCRLLVHRILLESALLLRRVSETKLFEVCFRCVAPSRHLTDRALCEGKEFYFNFPAIERERLLSLLVTSCLLCRQRPLSSARPPRTSYDGAEKRLRANRPAADCVHLFLRSAPPRVFHRGETQEAPDYRH